MSFAYKIYDQYRPHFITCTIHQCVDIFSRKQYADIFLDSIRYCQANKGLKVYGWVIMTTHMHLIIGSHEHKLSDIIRDFKKFTASQIVKAIIANNKESIKKWYYSFLKRKMLFGFGKKAIMVK